MNRFLFVCTGNTCRSPMAAALMAHRLQAAGIDGAAESAGIAATGSPAAANAVTVMAERGIDLSAHRSRPATAALCAEFDRIAVMSPVHRMALAAMGVAPDKIVVLAEETGGISDPYGGDEETYRRTRDELDAALDALMPEQP